MSAGTRADGVDPEMGDDDRLDVLYCLCLLDGIAAECERTQSRIRMDDRARAATLLDVALELVVHDFEFPMPLTEHYAATIEPVVRR